MVPNTVLPPRRLPKPAPTNAPSHCRIDPDLLEAYRELDEEFPAAKVLDHV